MRRTGEIFLTILALLTITIAQTHCAIADPAKPAATQPDWNQLDAEALSYFQTYLRFDTTNPPDDTSAAITFLKQILDKEGIETNTFTSKPGMVNLVARIPGPAGVKPLLLMSHADVVPVIAKDWSHPPFSADLADGFV